MPGVLPAPELIDAIAGEVADVHRRFREDGLPYGEDVAKRVDDCLDTGPDRIDAGRAWQQMIRTPVRRCVRGCRSDHHSHHPGHAQDHRRGHDR